MFCPNCGKEVTGKFCSNCGAPVSSEDDRFKSQADYMYDSGTQTINISALLRDEISNIKRSKGESMDYLNAGLAVDKRLRKEFSISKSEVRRVMKEAVWDKAPQNQQENFENNIARCPRCGSTSLSSDKKGFGIGKAVLGAAVAGPIGLVAGNLGAKKVRVTCLKCGHQFWAGK